MQLQFTVPLIKVPLPDGSEANAPDLSTVVHPDTGAAPISVASPIPTGADGQPLHATCEVTATFAD